MLWSVEAKAIGDEFEKQRERELFAEAIARHSRRGWRDHMWVRFWQALGIAVGFLGLGMVVAGLVGIGIALGLVNSHYATR